MVLITCNCLNVKVNIKQNPNTSTFDFLSDSGENSPFFPYKVLQVEVCDPGITLEQDYLVHRHHVGDWLVHRCLNCGLDVYATKPRSSKLLISQNIQYDPAVIERLRQSPNYSEVFELVLPEKESSYTGMPDRTSGGFESLQDVVNVVQEQLSNYILQEESEMENRIKQYEDEQKASFQQLQEKVRKQKKKMIGILLEAHKVKSKDEKKGTNSISKTPERSKPKLKSQQRSPLSRTKSTPVQRRQSLEEFDQNADGMFLLDGMETHSEEPFYRSDEEDEDDDFNEERTVVKETSPSVKKNKLVYSTSVPISVPSWGTKENIDFDDEDEEGYLPSDPEQIAASMQALAQSIHNDERYIFGERPRPRLNTGDFTNQ